MANSNKSASSNEQQPSSHEKFSDLTSRLEDIAAKIKAKDISLAQTLDLFDEAIALGSQAVNMVDEPSFDDVIDGVPDDVSDETPVHVSGDPHGVAQDKKDSDSHASQDGLMHDVPAKATHDPSSTRTEAH